MDSALLSAGGACAAVADDELRAGDSLFAAEFLRRYGLRPGLHKAELIEGIVHMPSPVRARQHAAPDNLMQGWLFTYATRHPEVLALTGPTISFDSENVLQPDAVLCRRREAGGNSWITEAGYLAGSPELVVEISASTTSIDLHGKLRTYRRHRVAEYVVWRTLDGAVDWFVLSADDFVRLAPSEEGVLRSQLFPGLALSVPALLAGDGAAVVAGLG